jgi:hypothetical protein
MKHGWLEFAGIGLIALQTCWAGAGDGERVKAAQAFRAKGEAVVPNPDGTIICEAEEFKVAGSAQGGWQAGYWGQNYYAATFANSFLSRKAYLGAPDQCADATASIAVQVKEAGRYLVLARYEAPYRFEAQFRIKIAQGGKTVLDRLYGARSNLKIWAFGNKLKTEVAWPWGAVENVVWEGHDAYVDLQPGTAHIALIAGKQPEPGAKRNVDLVLLTRDEAQVKERIEKENYLPLDGWLTQAGDVYLRVVNGGGAKVKVTTLPFGEHSPYWVHIRKWQPMSVEVEPGQTCEWTEVGGVLDALNDGQWGIESTGPCKAEFGVRDAAGRIEKIRAFDVNGKLALIAYADLRYSRKIDTPQEGIADLVGYLKSLPVRGKLPSQTLVMAASGILDALQPLYGLNGAGMSGPKVTEDWRGQGPDQLEAKCQALSAEARKNILVMSLGDEIGLPAPDGAAAREGFAAFLKAQGLTPKQVDPTAGDDWAKLAYNPDAKGKAANPGVYYWSRRYRYSYGIQKQKELTDVLRRNLPNAQIGANYSPHHGGYVHTYLGPVFQWVSCFRQDGMTLPWAEDYIWQVPVGTPQMNGINLDLFRAGLRGKSGRKILYYVMPHSPGNIPSMWRRLYYNALSHGMRILNLFEFDPVWAAYTENHVTGKEMYAEVLKALRELGLYEDIVQTGQRHAGEVGLWFSETGDIWADNEGSFAAAKRGLYIALQGAQLPLDFLVEDDALDGTLNRYKVLYLTDNHVSQAAAAKIAAWVKDGGRLFATAGAGMFDEYNRPNTVLRELLGVDQQELMAPADAMIGFIKQDLPFAKPLGQATWKPADAEAASAMPVFGAISKVKTAKDATVEGSFTDGSPAVTTRKAGKGQATYCAFLPSLSYFKPAIPLKPLDRGSTEDAMAHFIPTAFDAGAGALIASGAAGVVRPVETDVRLIETAMIESKAGTLITLQNWSGKPVKDLKVTVNVKAPSKAALAGGGKIETKRNKDQTVFVCDLNVADAIILR